MIPPAHKAHQTVSFSGCNGVSTYTCGLISFTQNAAVLFVDVAIQPEMRFIAKQNSLMKIGNNGNLVLGPFDESTPFLIIVLMNCQTKLRINHLTAVKSVAILKRAGRHSQYTWSLGTEVLEQMSRSGGQFEARLPVFKSPTTLGVSKHWSHLLTHCSRDERLSRPCPTRE
ncbi:alpha-2 adrenergic receptor [Trichonephila clavipes]|uniref:Alpha-2 adrenergic receptor n=1 Tax=Trichonephila clavipes TaxID=2585209 RepID=A0A8X6SR18_TRICX|nr:alpha-2 adrenergic receptor [Trichonephila clavipes]